MVDRVPLARLPTPLVPLRRLSEALGRSVSSGRPPAVLEVWCKRDDLTGIGLTGNKVRKLEVLLADALAKGADTVVTTGGVQSNHARATAVACRQLGLRPVLLLRGEDPAVPEANLLLDRLLGAEIRWCTPEEYRTRRNERMAEIAAELGGAYVIPEGGSNGLGALGYVAAAAEVAADGPFDHVVVAVGSGGTLAGLAMGADLGPVHGVAVCDDRAYFTARVRAIAAEAGRPLSDRWDVVEGYQGPAYGVATPGIWDTIALVARTEGLLLDPVYTGKAMHALVSEVRAGRWGGRILFWHTGGVFGLFGRGGEVPV